MVKYYIYTLTCPIENIVRYVGCTVNPDSRFINHYNAKGCEWRKSLIEKGLRPIMKIVSIVTSHEEAVREEKRVFDLFNNENMVSKDPAKYKYNDKKNGSLFYACVAKEMSHVVAKNVKILLKANRVTYEELNNWVKFLGGYWGFLESMDGERPFNPTDVKRIAIFFNCEDADLTNPDADLSHKIILKNGKPKEVNYTTPWPEHRAKREIKKVLKNKKI